MTPERFIANWQGKHLNERQGAQTWFIHLCQLLGVDQPLDPDNYCFERGARKPDQSDGWADVWKRGHFAWENKKPGGDLAAALKQLTDYALNLESPPLLVVADRERIVIHTAFTGYPDAPREIGIADLLDPAQREVLRWVFTDPERLKPALSCKAITEEAADRFSKLAEALRGRGEDRQRVAHFLMQCVFCLFAEDEGILPANLFADLLKHAVGDPDKARKRLGTLFQAMQRRRGVYGDHDIPWFNGGLFKTIDLPALIAADLAALHISARDVDWRGIAPSIFGTLFERGLDPDDRVPLGAHYTDPATIQKLIDPVVTVPLRREWEAAKEIIRAGQGKGPRAKDAIAAHQAYQAFMLRLYEFRVLDPACGSGNFLYLALKALRDLERAVKVEARELGLRAEIDFLQTGPHNILGLEVNEYAAELARVTVWIGDLQWCRLNGYPFSRDPILKPLDGIERRDALLNPDGTEAQWPAADAIVGNPPFLGGSKKRGALGDATFAALDRVYAGRVPGGADLVAYWFEKARAQIDSGRASAAGLVATQAIRRGANRAVLARVCASAPIFCAWSDEPWINEGAAVRVSLICFGKANGLAAQLDGAGVERIFADLTGSVTGGADLTTARPLPENAIAFEGTKKYGAFDIPGDLARGWLSAPNPHGKPNSDVVKPWRNGQDLTGRASDTWIVDFGVNLPEAEAALYEHPFQWVLARVKPYRETVRRERTRRRWWIHEEARVGLRQAIAGLRRYIATPRVAKHRFFVWCDGAILPDTRLLVVAREDDTTLGLLSSRIHLVWALANASMHGVGNDPTYNAKSCFETFPFPAGLTPADTAGPTETLESGAILPPVAPERRAAALAIAEAAHRLNGLRERWLNPPEWVERVPEVVPGYPERIVPKPGHAADLKPRTLTHLYNARPAWLDQAHRALDGAVAAAYGWDDGGPELPAAEVRRRLLALNRERTGA